MPPTTEPRSGKSLDQTVFWIIAAELKREAMRTHTSPATRHGRSSNTPFRARRFAESMHHPLIRIVSLQTGYVVYVICLPRRGRPVRCVSSRPSCLVSPLPSKVFAVSNTEEKPKTKADIAPRSSGKENHLKM